MATTPGVSTTEFTKEFPLEGAYLVYFNGIEIPSPRIQVDMANWIVPQATVNVAPDRELQRIGAEDKLEVAIFYLDHAYSRLTGKDPQFCLLFDGYITGWSYTNTPAGRYMTFRCVHHSRILDNMYASFLTGLDNMVSGVSASERNRNQVNSSHPGPLFPTSLLYTGVDSSAGTLIRRPFDLLENAFRACIDGEVQKKLASTVATNYFARYIRKVGLHNRILPSPLLEIDHMRLGDDDQEGIFPILRYVRYQDTLDTLTRQMQRMANGSLWDVLREMFLRLQYEILTIGPAPIAQVNFLGGGVKGEVIGPPVFDEQTLLAQAVAASGATGAGAAARLSGPVTGEYSSTQNSGLGPRPNRILNCITKPQWLFGIPPSCNVIFPSMITQYHFEEDYENQPTRVYMNDEWIPNALQVTDALRQFAVTAAAYPPQAHEQLTRRSNMLAQGNASVSSKNLLVWPEEYFKGPRMAETILPDWFLMIQQSMNRPTQYNIITPPVEADLETLQQFGWEFDDMDLDGSLVEGAIDNAAEDMERVFANAESDKEAAKLMKLVWLQRLYARYEYYRKRAGYRTCVAATTFNPYVLPGFSAVVFDDVAVGNHAVAYAARVTHTMSTDTISTTVSCTHAQTLDEYLQGIRDARIGSNPEARRYIVSAAPPHPIPEVRAVEQVYSLADQYFSELLHQKKTYQGAKVKTAAFDVSKAVDLQLDSGEKISTTYALGLESGGYAPIRGETRLEYLDRYQRLVPSTAYAQMFEQDSEAKRFISRPVCTLEEYISFREDGIRKKRVMPHDKNQGKGGTFYEEILDLEQGPGDAPTIDANNNLSAPVTAQTRADWATRLRNYRKKVIFQLHPQEV